MQIAHPFLKVLCTYGEELSRDCVQKFTSQGLKINFVEIRTAVSRLSPYVFQRLFFIFSQPMLFSCGETQSTGGSSDIFQQDSQGPGALVNAPRGQNSNAIEYEVEAEFSDGRLSAKNRKKKNSCSGPPCAPPLALFARVEKYPSHRLYCQFPPFLKCFLQILNFVQTLLSFSSKVIELK